MNLEELDDATQPFSKTESIHAEKIRMTNNVDSRVTLYHSSLKVDESVIENGDRAGKGKGEDYTKWASRYLYGLNLSSDGAQKDNQSS